MGTGQRETSATFSTGGTSGDAAVPSEWGHPRPVVHPEFRDQRRQLEAMKYVMPSGAKAASLSPRGANLPPGWPLSP